MSAKGTIFYEKKTLNLKGKLLNLEKPIVQGILNFTPDSFYDGGCYNSTDFALFQCEKMLEQGATIIDVGGQSTRPNAIMISEDEELKRVIPIVSLLTQKFPEAIFSIDTFRSKVALESINSGAHLINDISAGKADLNLLQTVAQMKVPYVLMHTNGTLETMHSETNYENFLTDMLVFFEQKIKELQNLGIYDIILDVGFGFSKTSAQNYYLMQNLDVFKAFELPLLVGISRKSMIYKKLQTTPEKALTGTIVLNTIALQKGASILRVHDVKEAVETIEIYQELKNVSI